MKYTATASYGRGEHKPHQSDTKDGINAWLAGFSSPEFILVTVTDKDGNTVGSKPLGHKAIIWIGRPAKLDRPRDVKVRLDQPTIDVALEISAASGRENISAGLRAMADYWREHRPA